MRSRRGGRSPLVAASSRDGRLLIRRRHSMDREASARSPAMGAGNTDHRSIPLTIGPHPYLHRVMSESPWKHRRAKAPSTRGCCCLPPQCWPPSQLLVPATRGPAAAGFPSQTRTKSRGWRFRQPLDFLGGRCWFRTSDPRRVKTVLYR